MKLRNSSEHPWKFLEIVGKSQIIFTNSDTLQAKNFISLTQKKLAGIRVWFLSCIG